MQTPTLSRVTVLPLTVQTVAVCDARVTVRPEDADGDSTTVWTPSDCGPGSGIVMVCAAFEIVNVRGTEEAAFHAKSPACDAVTAQVPADSRLISKPDTMQVDGDVEVKVTGRPEVATGATVMSEVVRTWFAGLANVMVWVAWLTVKVRVSEAAL